MVYWELTVLGLVVAHLMVVQKSFVGANREVRLGYDK